MQHAKFFSFAATPRHELIIKLVRFALLAIVVATPNALYATAGWTNSATASKFYSGDYGITVTLPSANNPAGCSNATVYRLPEDATNYEATAATLLSAVSQGKAISVFATSCDANGYSVINSVDVTL